MHLKERVGFIGLGAMGQPMARRLLEGGYPVSTISPLATKRSAATRNAIGMEMVDAPVFCGPAEAQAGTLSIMVGAEAASFERVKPLLERLGSSVVGIGESGSCQIAKTCNQLALCVPIEGIAEAFALCERLGSHPARLREAMLNGFAASRALDVFGEGMMPRIFDAGIESRLHHKDLQIVLELAHGLGLAVPAAAVTTQTFNALVGAGGRKARLGCAAASHTLPRTSLVAELVRRCRPAMIGTAFAFSCRTRPYTFVGADASVK